MAKLSFNISLVPKKEAALRRFLFTQLLNVSLAPVRRGWFVLAMTLASHVNYIALILCPLLGVELRVSGVNFFAIHDNNVMGDRRMLNS